MSGIVIQHIQTIWTKASRGGEGARQRNLLPIAMELPHFSRLGQFYLHHVTFAEHNSFQPQERTDITRTFLELDLKVLALSVRKSIQVRFHRDSYNAAKPTNYALHAPFELEQEQWAQIVYNGRFTDFDTGNWWYEKHAYNIGWFNPLERDRFVQTKPDTEFIELGILR